MIRIHRRVRWVVIAALSAILAVSLGGLAAPYREELRATLHQQGQPDIVIAPAVFEFGPVVVGQTKIGQMRVINVGQAELVINAVTLSGLPGAVVGFTAPLKLAPGAEAMLQVNFTPASEGTLSGALEFASNDPDEPKVSIVLRGTGVREITDLTVTANTTWKGNILARSITVAKGVTIVADEDLVVYTTGSFQLDGNLEVNCRAINLFVEQKAVIKGTIQNLCSAERAQALPEDSEPPAITLVTMQGLELAGPVKAVGSLISVSSQHLISSEKELRYMLERPNSPAITAPHVADGVSSSRHQATADIQPPTYDVIITIPPSTESGNIIGRYEGHNVLIATNLIAANGKAGKNDVGPGFRRGHDGQPGKNAILTIRTTGKQGRIDIAGGVTIASGDGGKGGGAQATSGRPATALGGRGAQPGEVRIVGETSDSEINILMGGPPGAVPQGVTLRRGNGGNGGLAQAIGSDGKNGCPPEDGGDAIANAGDGASVESRAWVRGKVNGLQNLTIAGGSGGNGGNAIAVGGKGGWATCCGKAGGRGGSMKINTDAPADNRGRHGNGGNAKLALDPPLRATATVDPNSFIGGRGDNASFSGGKGGNGGSCECSQAGDGGKGGDAIGGPGAAGVGPNGSSGGGGTTIAPRTGNGGDGGDGLPPGREGKGGTNATGVAAPDSFQPGKPGNPVLCLPFQVFDLVFGLIPGWKDCEFFTLSVGQLADALTGGEFLAAAHQNLNSLAIIDLASRQLKMISVGSQPHSVEMTPDGRRAFVGNFGSGDISVVDIPNQRAIETIWVGNQTAALSFDPKTNKLYAVNFGDSNVSIVQYREGGSQVVGTVRGLREPIYVVLSPDGRRGYVSSQRRGQDIVVFDTASTNIVGRVPMPNLELRKLAVSPDGKRLYAAARTDAQGTGQVAVIDTTSLQIVQRIPVEAFPLALTVTPSGACLIVTHSLPNKVSFIDLKAEKVLAVLPSGQAPQAAAISGELAYVTNLESDAISVYNLGSCR